MFNLGCTVVTEQTGAGRERGRSRRTTCCRCFPDGCATPLRVHAHPEALPPLHHRAPRAGRRTGRMGPATLLGDAAHPMVQYIAQGAAMALEDAICLAGAARRMRRRFRARLPALPGHPHRAHRARADFLADDGQAQPRQGRRAARCAIRCSRAAPPRSSTTAWPGSTPRRPM